MPLVATEDQHVASSQYVALAFHDQLDATGLAAEVFPRPGRVRHATHQAAGVDFHSREFQPGQGVGHQRPQPGAATALFAHFIGPVKLDVLARRTDELFDRYLQRLRGAG